MTPLCQRPRILFVTPVSPFSSASGSEQRSALMLAALRSIGDVDVLELKPGEQTQVSRRGEAHEHSVLALVQTGGLQSRYAPKAALTRGIEQALAHPLSDYQLIVGRYVWGICQLQIPTGVRLIVDLDDFHYRYARSAPWSRASAKERLVKFVAHRMLRRQLPRFHGAFVVSAQDQQEVSQANGLATVFLPNVAFSSEATPTPLPGSKQVLFVGSLWYRPNAEGVDWFLQQVWPRLRASVPDATLTLVGAAPQSVRTQWETCVGVSAPGFVPDLAASYRAAQLVVVPLHSGGGTNIKVLEALAYARLCLVTGFVAHAFAGHLRGGKDFLQAEDANAFVQQALLALASGPDLQSVASAGHASIQEHFSIALFQSRVSDFAGALLAKQQTPGGRA
jgi:glycosyltransferase involved in cell wall biosynthesis